VTHVTLLTDFGTRDGYVAAMKAVLANLAPDAHVSDAAHDLPQGDVQGGAMALLRYWRLYPPGSVHVVVVDPGVGTRRRAVAVEADGRFLVGPDNGVLSWALADAQRKRAVEIREPVAGAPDASATFHGRDVFAPAAAHLARGEALDGLGPAADDLVRLPRPSHEPAAGVVRGVVIAVDRFGNLITNIPAASLPPRVSVHVEGRNVGPLRRTYGDVEPGGVLALIGSLASVEVSVRDGNAAQVLAVERGARVEVRW
jgi:S-adenosyl-L-methionine hydrolase (adenosine-forming)